MKGFGSEHDALRYVQEHSNTVDVLVVLEGLDTLPTLLQPASPNRYAASTIWRIQRFAGH